MRDAALAFLSQLDTKTAEKVTYPLNHDERFNWNYVPCERNGAAIREFSETQREAAHDLMRSVLSTSGYSRATEIMKLEAVLKVIEGREDSDQFRDPEGYFLTVFGDVESGPWGWRVDGHHLSLTFTSTTETLVSTTPSFWGSNPAEVPSGPHKGLRLLNKEEDLGRDLLLDLDPSQKQLAIFSEDAPSDIITKTDKEARIGESVGLPTSEMSGEQRDQVVQLVAHYASNFRTGLAEHHLSRIQEAGIENLYFGWAGSQERRAPHYYRIHGPTLLIEYDNTQNDANHIHTVMRDLEEDFGQDLLKKHYDESNHHI
jgi:hypothetical protein